jgi:hypothetical protein
MKYAGMIAFFATSAIILYALVSLWVNALVSYKKYLQEQKGNHK